MNFNNNFNENHISNHRSKFDLHYLEEKLMVSPLKKLMLSYLEFNIFIRLLRSANIDLKGKCLLEVGCGAGYGIEQIYNYFKPKKFIAFDINSRMISLSAAKIKKKFLPVKVFIGDVKNIKLPKNKFDAVFVITVLHHVEKWRIALKEINRVLKPKGYLLINEINSRSLNWFERYLKVYHPKKGHFNWRMFKQALNSTGFFIIREYKFLSDFGFFLCIKVK